MNRNCENSAKSELFLDMTPILSGETDRIDFSYDSDPKLFCDTELRNFSDITFLGSFCVSGFVIGKAGYMEATIHISLPYRTNCSRCLAPMEEELKLTIHKPVANTKGKEKITDETTEEYLLIYDSKLNIGAIVSEEIELNFPFKHLCREDCKGLCPKCGKDLNEGECSCPKKEIDPHLEKLKELFSEE